MFNLPYNKFHKTLEIVTFILLLAQIVYTAVLYPQLPSKIPSHFNLEGQIDGWSGKGSIIILVIVNVALYILLTVTMFFPRLWNMPVKITDKNKGIVFNYTINMVLLDKLILVMSFSYITYCSISATKMGWWFTSVMLVGVLGVTFYYTFKLFLVK